MAERISQKTKGDIVRLYAEGKTPIEISKLVKVGLTSVYGLTTVLERTNPKTGKPFKSRTELRNYNAGLKTNPSTGKPFRSEAERRNYKAGLETNPDTGEPFGSQNEYDNHKARQEINPKTGRPFGSWKEHADHMAEKRINPETGRPFKSKAELDDFNVRQRINPHTGEGHESGSDYNRYMEGIQARRPENIESGDFIRWGLGQMGGNQAWLASQLGVTDTTVRRYIRGITIPREETKKVLYSVLEISPEHLEGIFV
jgi:hypothetical protein